MSGRPPPALLSLAASQPPGNPLAEQPSSSNDTQDTGGQAEPALGSVPSQKRLEPSKSILKTADSLKNNEYKRNISWMDHYGQSLTQVVEFEPSEHADSEYDDLEERGCCVVM